MAKKGLTAAALGRCIDVTRQRVGQLADEGVLPRMADGSFDREACTVAYIRLLRSERSANTQSASATRVQDARADEIAMRIEERTKALVAEARSEALAAVDEVAGGLKADLMALPARLTKDLALRRRLEEEIESAFDVAAKRAAQMEADEEPAEPPNRAGRRRTKASQRR